MTEREKSLYAIKNFLFNLKEGLLTVVDGFLMADHLIEVELSTHKPQEKKEKKDDKCCAPKAKKVHKKAIKKSQKLAKSPSKVKKSKPVLKQGKK